VFAELGVRRVDNLEALFAESDVLVELAPARPENRHLVNEALLRRLPDGASFVNVGRGMVVDEAALARVAAEGRLQVALDVYETEPLPADSPLRGLPNVTLLPHLGGPTRDRRAACGRLALANLRNYLAGQPLENLVTPDVYDRAT
jgi:phosphoglycerate dehydrogenase-like enzyme